MKKLISLLLVLVMALSLAACTSGNAGETTGTTTEPTTEPTTAPTTEPVVTGPATALEAMETIWNGWNFEYKDYFMGGGYTNMVNGMPGAVETTDTDALQALLYVPEANWADIQSAASVMHAMNANTFTAAAFNVADAAAFAGIMKDTLLANQWICGSPELLLVYTVGNTVLIAFGTADNVNSYRTAVTTAYADAVSVFDGAFA